MTNTHNLPSVGITISDCNWDNNIQCDQQPQTVYTVVKNQLTASITVSDCQWNGDVQCQPQPQIEFSGSSSSSSGGTLKSPPQLLFEAQSSNNNNNTLHVPTRTRRSKRTIPHPELNSNNNPKKRKTQRYSLPLRGNLPETGSPDDPVYSSELQMTEDDSQLFLKHRDIIHQIRTTIQVTASYRGGFQVFDLNTL